MIYYASWQHRFLEKTYVHKIVAEYKEMNTKSNQILIVLYHTSLLFDNPLNTGAANSAR